MIETFDIPREQLLTDRGIALSECQMYNALYDAEVIKTVYETFISKVNKEGNDG